MTRLHIHQTIILVLALTNSWLVGELIGLTPSTALINISAVLCLSLIIINQLEYRRWYKYMDAVLICLAMLSGMLIGIFMDFGRYGLLTMFTICQNSEQFISMLQLAPWTHFGMLASCSIAIVYVQKNAFSIKGCVKHGCCLMAMLAGMWLLTIFPSDAFNSFSQSKIISNVLPLLYMWLLMSLPMTIFFVTANMSKSGHFTSAENTNNKTLSKSEI